MLADWFQKRTNITQGGEPCDTAKKALSPPVPTQREAERAVEGAVAGVTIPLPASGSASPQSNRRSAIADGSTHSEGGGA